jgi:hypothetical protein
VGTAVVATLLGCFSSASAGTATSRDVTRGSASHVARGSATHVARASAFGSNWTTYHGTAEATGVSSSHAKLRPVRPAWTSPTLDGQLYGEPLVADGRVIAATENNTVYVMATERPDPLVAPSGEARAVE